MKNKITICAICACNRSIIADGIPGCMSECVKYKNRAWTIQKNKMNNINPVTGKPNSECSYEPHYNGYGYQVQLHEEPLTEYHLCSEKNKGDCKHFKKTDKLLYINIPKCPDCNKEMEMTSHWRSDTANYKCEDCNVVLMMNKETMKIKDVLIDHDYANGYDDDDSEYKKRKQHEKELKIKLGLISPEPEKIKATSSPPKLKSWWKFW